MLASLPRRSRWQSTLAATSDFERAESSEAPVEERAVPIVSDRIVRTHLLFIASLVFGIVVLGGLTRLTESGLSITEWELVTGVLPPRGDAAWQVELSKYLATPEGRLCVVGASEYLQACCWCRSLATDFLPLFLTPFRLNKNITMSEFKRIYLYEWSHRLLGRLIGLAFLRTSAVMIIW